MLIADLIAGNLVSLLVISKVQLDLKGSFIRLIATLCIFDCLCIILNLLLFSGPLLSEYYRHQVSVGVHLFTVCVVKIEAGDFPIILDSVSGNILLIIGLHHPHVCNSHNILAVEQMYLKIDFIKW